MPGSPDILAAEIIDADAHDPVEIVAASALGGSSHWWGGRCLPLDPVDLRSWPIGWNELLPWWRHAAEQIGAGALIELPAPGNFGALGKFHATTAESWAPDPNLSRRWRNRIRAVDGPAIVLGARVIGLRHEAGKIADIEVRTQAGIRAVKAGCFVLTCGGLGVMRLLLMAQRAEPHLFGGPDGPLGRGYMGHLTGSIADLVFADKRDAEAFNFIETEGGYFQRRRILPHADTVVDDGIVNIAWWLDSPARGEASHGSATASARFLAASAVRVIAGKWTAEQLPPLAPHFANVGKAPFTAAIGLTQTAWTLAASRVMRQRHLPRRFLSAGGGWRMVYHAEQICHPGNRISLSEQRDSLGLPKLRIDFRFDQEDIASVVRAHELLDKDLQAAGLGKLRWRYGDGAHAAVADAARDGYHQLGGAVISDAPADGVVDRNCQAHGLENLFIASGCVFPTGGQANPTLTIVALACRLAEHIASLRRPVSARSAVATSAVSEPV